MLWTLASVLLIVWLVAVLLGKGGFIHILLLCGISIVVLLLVEKLRTMRG